MMNDEYIKRQRKKLLEEKNRAESIRNSFGENISADFTSIQDFLLFKENWGKFIDQESDFPEHPFRLYDRPLSEFEAEKFLKKGIDNSHTILVAKAGTHDEDDWYTEDLIICFKVLSLENRFILIEVSENQFEEASNHLYFIEDNWIQFEAKTDCPKRAMTMLAQGKTRAVWPREEVNVSTSLTEFPEKIRQNILYFKRLVEENME